MTRTANANGVTDYTVFSSGMDTPMHSAADSRLSAPEINSQPLGGREQIALNNEVEALDFVSSKTGGVTAVGAGSVPKFVDRVSAELDTAKTGYYTYELEVMTSGPDARLCIGVWDEKGNEAGFAVVKPSGPG